jgi:exopolyphosphatase/guanosine-5'-triphosphate,3'-diphosphate pyrophosphatase
MRIAAIDIGTNTLLMLIGEYTNNGTTLILRDEHAIARLGEGVDKTGFISNEALERSQKILLQYKNICEQLEVNIKTVKTTSAVRDARNSAEIRSALAEIIKAPVEVISGDEEARLSFIGSSEAFSPATVIDIGGGSTEYITGEHGSITRRKSLQMGAVRLFERYLKTLPPSADAIAAARAEIRSQLAQLSLVDILADTLNTSAIPTGTIIGVGGTFTTLAAMDLELQKFDSTLVHLHTLSLERVQALSYQLLSSDLSTLLHNPAVHPKRADILPAGALILEESLRFFGASSCLASTKGLRYGILYDTIHRLLHP